MNKRTDCFGLCCCKETSVLFCRRKFLTENQKQWPFYGSKSEYVERLDYTTLTQKFLYQHFSKRLLTNSGICLVLLIWTGLIIVAINACRHLTIDFRTSYLINGDSYIKQYIDLSDEYFNRGELITIYFDNSNSTLDYTSAAN